MNAPIARLFGLVIVLFALLVGFTSYWTVFAADDLKGNEANKRPQLESLRVERGRILTSDGAVIARDRGDGKGASRVFERSYPQGELFAHPVGYSYLEEGQTGIEDAFNDTLAGNKAEFLSILDQLRGRRNEGDDVETTLDVDAQRTALSALGGRPGAVVALEPKTGRVRVMASNPSYDPNAIPRRLSELNSSSGAPVVNRATQSQYPPGSTMKVVTAAAALDSGRFNPSSTLDGSSPQDISGVPLANFGGESFGPVDLTAALTNSVNTVWAQVAVQLGDSTMFRYMKRFGFYDEPPLEYPANQLAVSGVRGEGGKLLDDAGKVDIGRVGIGQGGLLVTPLQMALVVGTVANGGQMMRPQLVETIRDPDGRSSDELEPDKLRRVMSAKAAGQLRDMMTNVVKEGSGTAAALEGIDVAGKTGTAEVGGRNQPWFVAFAPSDKPTVAIAATVERSDGTGGEVAAPIAKRVMQELLK
ncbi:MAG: peptidoglycan D,D-transpeptidase FtsI family protein [Solirubrobacterales bacterium]